jgi:hypothetical protein
MSLRLKRVSYTHPRYFDDIKWVLNFPPLKFLIVTNNLSRMIWGRGIVVYIPRNGCEYVTQVILKNFNFEVSYALLH